MKSLILIFAVVLSSCKNEEKPFAPFYLKNGSKITTYCPFVLEGNDEFVVKVREDSTGFRDTIIRGDLVKAVKILLIELSKTSLKQEAAQELLQTLNCSVQPNDSLYKEFVKARFKYYRVMGFNNAASCCNCK